MPGEENLKELAGLEKKRRQEEEDKKEEEELARQIEQEMQIS